jgi:uncharacterized membrane protein
VAAPGGRHRSPGRREPNLTKASLRLGPDRIVFFSDAVMAIALTLLVTDLKLPDIPTQLAAAELPGELNQLSPRIISFEISFAEIDIYWLSHHRHFSCIKRHEGRLMAPDLVFLYFVVLMPFAASFQGQYGYLPVGMLCTAAPWPQPACRLAPCGGTPPMGFASSIRI